MAVTHVSSGLSAAAAQCTNPSFLVAWQLLASRQALAASAKASMVHQEQAWHSCKGNSHSGIVPVAC